MDRIGTLRSAIWRTASVAALALFVMSVAHPAAAQTAPAAAAPAPQDILKFTSAGPAIILFQINAAKTAEFESAWSSMRAGFEKVTEADPKAFAAALGNLYKLDQPPIDVGGQKAAVYVLRVDSVSTTYTYNPVAIVYEMLWGNGKDGSALKREEADAIYAKFKESFLNITPWKLNKIG